jgi:hypothetical protein
MLPVEPTGDLFPEPMPNLQNLFWDMYYLNQRIEQGDIASNKSGLVVARRICDAFAAKLKSAGAEEVFLDPYCAAGGWIGLTYSYYVNDLEERGSLVVRRIDR